MTWPALAKLLGMPQPASIEIDYVMHGMAHQHFVLAGLFLSNHALLLRHSRAERTVFA
ncbi:hypothetical protein [Pseudomonas mandelii]|uniref:hypothetical protein n=1 Tax=Pseudomonas mandelii TaxID=75612 RepID=UPI001375977D|nr:hypothetical protein [Pseudomonas mandelii]